MPFSPSDSKIFAPLFGDAELAAIFSDEAYAKYLLRVEGALARGQGALGIIPRDAAEKIADACAQMDVDLDALARGVADAGFPIIALVKQIQVRVGDAAAPFTHFGATTQDIMDTALVLQMRDALEILQTRLCQVIRALAARMKKYRATVMAGRTHTQHALPITFGFKIATWLAPLLRDVERLQEFKPRVFVVQLGGAVGTLAALGENGIAAQDALARELNLNVPLMSWHTRRDSLAEVANWLSLVSASLGKMAQDILLLAQSEIAEVREAADRTRGASSTMPQKNNPVVSELIVAAARANAVLLSNMHHALMQEHERGTYGLQLEWLTLPQMFVNTASALRHAQFLCEHLVVDETRMLENMRASYGTMLAEAFTFAMSKHMSRADVQKVVAQACEIALRTKRHLSDVLQDLTDAPLDWEMIGDEKNYLGAAEEFCARIERAVERVSCGETFAP